MLIRIIMSLDPVLVKDTKSVTHSLIDNWVLWAHLPHNTDWSLKSYIKIKELSTVEDVIKLTEGIPEKMVKNCMLFLMKSGVNPMWEDKNNVNGGCFSFKIPDEHVYDLWKNLNYALTGGSISKNDDFLNNITGITLSPKKLFFIVKVWMKDLNYQNPREIIKLNNLNTEGCLFKRHKSY